MRIFKKCFQFASFCLGRNTTLQVELLRKQVSPEKLLQSGQMCVCDCTKPLLVHGSVASVTENKSKVTPPHPLGTFSLPQPMQGVCSVPFACHQEKGIDRPGQLQRIVLNPCVCPWPARAGNAGSYSVISLIVFLTPVKVAL